MRSTKDISATVRLGRCFNTPYVRWCIKASKVDHSRVACVVGKKVSRRAVDRHRYQRWLREVSRLFLDVINKEPVDIVFIAKPGMAGVKTQKELHESLERSILQALPYTHS